MAPQPLDRAAVDIQARRRPAGGAGRLDDRPEERGVQRGNGQPALEALHGRRAGRAGRRPAVEQPAVATRPCGRRSTREFVSHHYDLKHVMRLILNSRAYQLDSDTLAGERGRPPLLLPLLRPPPARPRCCWTPSAARPACRMRSPATPSASGRCNSPTPASSSYFLTIFGRSERVTACACERSGDVTLPQLLHLPQRRRRPRERSAPTTGRLAALRRRRTRQRQAD